METAVFAAALLLAAFIGRELWQRRAPASASVEPAEARPAPLNPDRPSLPTTASRARTETAVSAVGPIKLARVQRRKPKAAAVPVPK